MNKLYENFRINLDKAILAAGGAAYSLSGGKYAKGMFTKSVAPAFIGTDVRIISENEDSVTIAKTDVNGRIVNKGFKILSATDMHFGDDPVLRDKCLSMLMKHIAATRPDLVVLTGDIILGKFQHLDAIQFAQFMEKIGIYWAFVFGNHEAREEKGRFKELLMKCQTRFPHCLARQGRSELFGLCNYCINIMKSENEILKTLFMFDSGRDIIKDYCAEHGCPEDYTSYDFIKNNQLDWYEKKLGELTVRYGDTKSFAYMHIPIKEYENAICETQPGKFEFTDKCKVIYGSAHESVGSSHFNSGLFALAKRLGSTQAFFSGHDHVNDFCAVYDGIYLVYNQCCGYETYTLEEKTGADESQWLQGATLTKIQPDGEFEISQRFNRDYL